MQVLALDCTAKSVSVAMAEDGMLIGDFFLNVPVTHSETLLPMCEQLLKNTGKNIETIDAFAVTAGPGSFTGVRIGISAVKGLAFAKKQPVFSFSTTEAMALGFKNIVGFSGTICCLMDARCNQFYNALFEIKNGKIRRLVEDRIIILQDLVNELKMQYNENVIFVGDGAKLFFKAANDTTLGVLAPEQLLFQKASYIAIEASLNKANLGISPEQIRPVYLRKSQAEREKEKITNNIHKEI